MVLIAAGISVSLWLSQPDGGPGPALGPNEGVNISDSAELEVTQGEAPQPTGDAGETGPRVLEMKAAVGGANVSDSAELEVQQGKAPQLREDASETASGLTAADGANVGDLAELKVRKGETPPTQGGLGTVARIQDSAILVVRDGSGKIKQQLMAR